MKQNDLIKIAITKVNRKSNDGKNKWSEFLTPMMLVVAGEEDAGKQKKWVKVAFDDAIKKKELSRGLLTVKVADISFPKKYEVIVGEDGKKKYPRVYINSFIEFHPVEVEVENCFVTDDFEVAEQETEEVEITEEQ